MAQLKDLIVTGPSRLIGQTNIDNLVATGTLNGFTLGKSVPANAVFTDTTYGAATTSAAGLMSATDKSKLDGITASADTVSFSQSLTTGTKVGTITINGTATDLYCKTLELGTTSTTALKGDTKYAGSASAGGSATSAVKLDTATAGSATQPCYFTDGKPSACTYSLNKTVPDNAVFTDASCTQSGHYSPGTEDSNSKKTASSGKYISGIKLDAKKHVVGIEEGSLPTFSESYKGTVTSVTVEGNNGLTGSGTVNSSGTITISGVDATTSAKGVVTTTDQTFAGKKIFSSGIGIGSGSNIASFTIDGSSLSLDKELIVTAGGSKSDITPDIACAMKANRFQATNLFTQNVIMGTSSGTASSLAINFQKYTGVSSTAPSGLTTVASIDTNGKMSASGGFFQSSDERLKNFHGSIPVDLDKLGELRKDYFTWKEGENKDVQIGVSAQEIQKIYPEIVSEDSETGKLTVAYDKLSVVALAAVDKLHAENQELKDRLTKLEEFVYGNRN